MVRRDAFYYVITNVSIAAEFPQNTFMIRLQRIGFNLHTLEQNPKDFDTCLNPRYEAG